MIIQINFESLKNTMLIFEERIFTNKKKKKKEERNVSNLRHIESYRSSSYRACANSIVLWTIRPSSRYSCKHEYFIVNISFVVQGWFGLERWKSWRKKRKKKKRKEKREGLNDGKFKSTMEISFNLRSIDKRFASQKTSDHYDELYRQALEKQALRHTRKASRVIFALRTQCFCFHTVTLVWLIYSVRTEWFLVTNTTKIWISCRDVTVQSFARFFFLFFPPHLFGKRRYF